MRRVALAVSLALGLLRAASAAAFPPLVGPSEERPREPSAQSEPEPEPSTAPRYGSAGALQITNVFSVGGSHTSFTHSDADRSSTVLAPAIDWFVARHLAVGLASDVAFSSSRGYAADNSLVQTHRTRFGGSFRLIYVLELGERISLAPAASFGVDGTTSERTPVQGPSSSTSDLSGTTRTTAIGTSLAFHLPLLLHPTRHFFVGIGPSVFHRFARTLADPSSGGEETAIGAEGVVGIWWGGESTASEANPDAEAPVIRDRFGEAGQVVVTGAFDASFISSTYGTSGSTAQTFTLSPGADWFIRDHFSLGFDLAMSVTYSRSLVPPTRTFGTSSVVTAKESAFAVGPRIGAEIPLGPRFSLYPRAAIDIGTDDVDFKAGDAENKHSVTTTALILSAPLLFHVIDHAFIGAGPSLYTELSATEKDSNAEVRTTRVGAGTLLGGWF